MLQIISQNECQFVQINKEFALIRIEDDKNKFVDLDIKPRDSLSLIVHDISLSITDKEDISLPDNWIIFDEFMARRVLSFFETINSKDEDLIIHCYAGFSRSSAIGLSYAWYLKDDVLEQSLLNSHYTPNTKILYEMAKVLGVLEEKQTIINYYNQYK